MSSTAQKPTETNQTNNTPQAGNEKQNQTLLSTLEEDDEFEEFPVQDWDDSETNLAQLTGTNGGNGNQLWEDNWDDDDIEDEFSLQLRNELGKANKSSAGGDAMQH
ncbi:hypothetical protein Clacol_002356 [Clathrus columnatus]|uniref:26S proteasome complex subunit SEM1 n=1 Tax=Clathrus columnatus TaxID=1419009 RepID=A0AAV5A3V0_9AGAM|nr:hypothetical protein Clacol_002356 [Clathrus columnatus]